MSQATDEAAPQTDTLEQAPVAAAEEAEAAEEADAATDADAEDALAVDTSPETSEAGEAIEPVASAEVAAAAESTDDVDVDATQSTDDDVVGDAPTAPAEPTPRPTDDLEPELLFPATISLPASHTELFEIDPDPNSDAPTAHFHLSEGDRGRYALGEHVLRGRPAIDLTFNVDANGILSLSFRESFRGRQATLEVFGGGGMTTGEVEALAEHQRAVEEALRRQRRTQALKLRLGGLRERGLKVLGELAEGIPAGDRDRLRAIFKAIHDAVVSGSLSALEAADEAIDGLLVDLPAAIQQAIREPSPPAEADAAKRLDVTNPDAKAPESADATA